MAEERLIDEDKDRKYKIRKNADGEDELYIDETVPVEETEEVMFDVPEVNEDSEEEAVMTPEQLAAKRAAEEREREEREAQVAALISSAKADMAEKKYATALEYLEEVTSLDETNGEAYALRMAVYTSEFTDYSQVLTAAEYADEVEEYTDGATKESMFLKAQAGLEQNISALEEKAEELHTQNEQQKARRALKFKKDRNVACIIYGAVFAVFAVCTALAIYFSTLIFTVQTSQYIVITAVFAGIAVILLILSLVALRRVFVTCRRVRLNKRNTATKLGREWIATQKRLDAFKAIYKALKG